MMNKKDKNYQLPRKQKILIADDSEINRAILADMLEGEYMIVEAEDGIEAVELLHTESGIDLVLLDIMMPRMDGFEVLSIMNQYHWIEDTPVIMISSENSSSYVSRAYGLGVTDYINRPFDENIVRRRVVNTLMLYEKQKRLAQMVSDKIYENEKQNSLMVNILSHIVEFRNGESGPHVLHIYALTKLLLNCLIQKTDQYNLSYTDISLISTASSLHDIGKISIPDNILNKPGPLTTEEFDIMKTHSMAGANMLEALPFYMDEPIVKISYEICRYHHERYDGLGYPDGLKGEEIPISAQIVSLADVYDALTSERVYKKAISHEKAIKMILHGECGVFNPLLLECLTDISSQIQMELRKDPFHLTHKIEIRNISSELSHHTELSASERTLHLLERERTKYQFLALMSREIQFEYTEATHMVTISDWGVKELGLKDTALNPYTSNEIVEIMGKNNLKKLDKMLRTTTPEKPDIHQDFQMNINGELRWFHFICRATWLIEDSLQYLGAVGKVIDNNEEHNHFLKLQHMAEHDSLTKLLTHACAKEQIKQVFLTHPNSNFALIIIDVDKFKDVNDHYGHMFGDKILCYVANNLQDCSSENVITSRIGGDEFLYFFEYQDKPKQVVESLFHSLCNEYEGVGITVSLGVSITQEASYNYEELLKKRIRLYMLQNLMEKTGIVSIMNQ